MLTKRVLNRILGVACVLGALLAFMPDVRGQACATCSAGTITCANQAVTTGDPDAGQRLAVNGVPSTCAIPTSCPTPAVTGATRFDRYTFTNTLGVPTCFTVTLNNAAAGCGISLFSAAYTPTFVPGVGNTCTNYLADVGISVTSGGLAGSYSFTLANAQQIQIVVYNRNVGQVCTSTGTYTLTITPCPGGTVTGVSVKSFTAVSSNNGPVVVQWEAAFGVQGLGFNVYREVGGQRVRLNSEMIVAPAFALKPDKLVAAPRKYEWKDTSPAGNQPVKYWLEQIDVKGETKWIGPISPRQESNRSPKQN